MNLTQKGLCFLITLCMLFSFIPNGFSKQETPPVSTLWNIDGSHSNVMFRIKHFNASYFYGTFREVSGKVVEGEKGIEKIHVKIATKSVFTNSKKRDKHLKNADFFNTKKYPFVVFKSTKVEEGKVTGTLKLHGVTKTVTAPFEVIGTGKDPWGNTRKGAHAVFNIKRSDYNMKYMMGGLGDDIQITISLETIMKKEKK